MKYNKFGNTGVKISALGFGGMRLPEQEIDGKWVMDEEKSIELLQYAYKRGVNYFDTAYIYTHDNNEDIVGRALKQVRDKIMISTKLPTGLVKSKDDFERFLDEQMRRLDTPYIDFYHMHGLSDSSFNDVVIKYNLIESAEKAKSKGLIKHISFSFHDKPQIMKKIIDTGVFESVLCQYNMIDSTNREAMEYAKTKGLGVVVMGPIAGGNLAIPNNIFDKEYKGNYKSMQEIALRYVLSNKNVDCALSGMNTMQMIEENATIAENDVYLYDEDMKEILNLQDKTKKLSDLYCTGCNYCMPCPREINIPRVFSLMNLHKVYNLTEIAKEGFKKVDIEDWAGKHPKNCIECGVCEGKCPQKIKIINQLKECIAELD